jgi:hypothetical protein
MDGAIVGRHVQVQAEGNHDAFLLRDGFDVADVGFAVYHEGDVAALPDSLANGFVVYVPKKAFFTAEARRTQSFSLVFLFSAPPRPLRLVFSEGNPKDN